MSVFIRTGALAAAALLALTACSSQTDTDGASEDNPQASSVCVGINDYQTALNEALKEIDPDIANSSTKKQEEARDQLVDVMVKETQVFAKTVPDDAPDDVQPALETLIEGMESNNPDDPKIAAANETLTKYIQQECPDFLPGQGAPESGAPADGDAVPSQ